MDGDDPWRNKGKVKVLAVMDMLIGVILLIMYLYHGISFLVGDDDLPRGFLGPTQAGFLVAFLGLSVLTVNVTQIGIAFKMYRTVKQVEVSARQSIHSAKLWFRGNIFFCFLLTVKFFILLLFNFESVNALDFIFCFTEFLFRTVGWYFVKEFMDDLTAEATIQHRCVQNSLPLHNVVSGDYDQVDLERDGEA